MVFLNVYLQTLHSLCDVFGTVRVQSNGISFVLDLNGVGVLYTWECCVCILTVVNRLTMVALTRSTVREPFLWLRGGVVLDCPLPL